MTPWPSRNARSGRGRRYAGLVLDPPSYGHGPRGTAWRIDDGLEPLLATAGRLLEPDAFLLLTAHTPEFDPDRLASLLRGTLGRRSADVEAAELELTTVDGRGVALGAFARIAGGA